MQVDYNLIVGAAGIIIGVIASGIFTYWAISQSRRIATEGGSFKKAAPSIYFLKYGLLRNSNKPTNWVFLCPKDAESTVYSLSFQVGNEGDAPLDSPILTIQGSADCIKDIPNADDVCKVVCIPGVMESSIKRSIVNLGNFNQISYMLPYIGINAGAEVTDLFSFKNTVKTPVTGEAVSKDKIKLKYTVELSYSYVLSVTLLTKDYPTVEYDLKIICCPADNINEAKDLIASEFSKKSTKEKEWYAILQFPVEKKLKYKRKYLYFMEKYSEEGFKAESFYM